METCRRSELRRYLIQEQGMEEDVVMEMSSDELLDLYEMYHED